MESNQLDNIKVYSLKTGIISLGLFIPFSGFIQEVSYQFQLIPFLISMVFLGLPHGAMDHLVPSKMSQIGIKKSVRDVTILYTFSMMIYAIWWFIHPLSATAFFIGITWLHWGQGDLYAIKELNDENYLEGKLSKILSLSVRGGIPMIVPLLSYPSLYSRFIDSLFNLFSVSFNSSVIMSDSTGLIAFYVIGGLSIGNAVIGYLSAESGNLTSWFYNQFEVLFLWIYFLLLPPVFAIGIYFCFWHSLRHIMRLSLIDEDMPTNLTDGNYYLYIKNLAKDTGPLTLLSVTMMAGFSLILPGQVQSLEAATALYLVGISILTLPHFIVVSWMDYKQKIWS